MERSGDDQPLTLTIGHEELVVRQRYEVLSIVNDVLIGLWFAIGSALFFSEATRHVGTWLFLLGSLELMIRPGIRLVRRVHLQRISGRSPEAGHDF